MKKTLILASLLLVLLLLSACGDYKDADEDISKVYVTYQKADKVGVINASTGEIIREVDVDFTPGILDRPHFVVIDDENKKWYATLISSGIVAKFDLLTDELEDTVDVGNMPALMTLSQDGQFLYVSRFMPMGGVALQSKEIHKIRTSDMSIMGTVDVDAESPHGITIDLAGDYVWSASFSSSCLFKIDVEKFGDPEYEPERFPLASEYEQSQSAPGCASFADNWAQALQMEMAPSVNRVYITLSGRGEVRSYDTETGALFGQWPVGSSPWHLVVSPDGNAVIAANRGDNSVSVIDLSHDVPPAEITGDLFNMPHGVGVSHDGERIFITSSAASGGISYLHIIDSNTLTISHNVVLGEDVMATGLAVMQSVCSDCD
ncbi:MAG: beta-propeller fold lactonase family protein [Candidatus Marinimicrobia bacterium]|nr:beta-propeller fold lactonase family protein [Candidatus Neomarinimicrobiota bacterium]MDP6592697.1 beta-propeller fold lactonase family protein [Candidatus Neomarinimicrobiota bacterium]MDP6835759.1 beta-propeller fold lactonase family protein [Candidatus Neomarinimicrobiota bacterium]MDP6966375.1 beta-propeller fold lactonase family protein [Candidatus Neomarinimicrobiota bacterium]